MRIWQLIIWYLWEWKGEKAVVLGRNIGVCKKHVTRFCKLTFASKVTELVSTLCFLSAFDTLCKSFETTKKKLIVCLIQ